MRRLLRALRHSVREARDGLWRNPGLSLLSAVSIGVSLYILGLFLLLAFNLDRFVEALGRDAQAQIYLLDSAGTAEIDSLRALLAKDPAVASARFVSRGEALRRFQATFPALKDLPAQIGGAGFPPSFEIVLRQGHRDRMSVEALDRAYRGLPGVAEVRYDLAWLERLAAVVTLVRRGGAGIGVLLLAAVMVTVGAVVRLTVLARREEIEIMKLVGATASFIRGPFLLGASAQGVAGGAIAIGALAITHRLIERSAVFRENPFLTLVVGQFLPREALFLILGGGLVLGLIAAALSLRRAASF
jgi:cell division transport system permease protein